jgi:hypothetical protein
MICIGEEDVVFMITKNILDIRKIPIYRDALIMVYIEVGSSHVVASGVRNLVDRPEFDPLIVESRDSKGEGRPGVITGPEQKRVGTQHLSRELSRNTLGVAEHLVTQDKKKAITELSNQMRSWRKELIVPRDQAVGVFKEVFTGKSTTGGKKDDRIMALMLALYWSAYNHYDPKFVNEMMRRGISI